MFKKIFKLLFGQKKIAEKERISNLNYQMWQREKAILEKDQEIAEDKHNLKQRSWNRRIPFGKLFLIFLFINFTILEVFTGWVTISSIQLAYATGGTPDFTPLVTILGAVLGETIAYGIYSAKSKAENVQGGIVHDMAIKNNNEAVG